MKIRVLGFIYDRLNNIVNEWTFNFFTKEGKEVIIKSLVTVLSYLEISESLGGLKIRVLGFIHDRLNNIDGHLSSLPKGGRR